MWNPGLIIFSPCVERERLAHNGYTYLTSTKTEPLNVKTSSTTCIKKSFLLRQDLFLCLGALFFCTYNCAFLLWNALPHPCSASNQNKCKVLFPLFVFRKTFQLQNKLQNSLRKLLSLQILLLEKLENKYTTWLFNFKTSPLKCLFLNNHQIYTQKPFRGK